ncbi:Pro-kumamolisin, activation domain-containing protein, partial [Bisporella sp. PMI_857]
MLGFQLLFLASLLTTIVTASEQPYSIHKRAPDRHDGWERGQRASPDLIVPVQVNLAETATDEGADYLLALADPSSPSFGQYWSAQEVTLLFALPERDIQAVLQWIANGSGNPPLDPRLSPCRCRVYFNATILQLERLLRTEYYVYKHIGTSNTSLACEQYSLPVQLQPLVDFIIPTVFPTRAPPMAAHPVSSQYKFDVGGMRTATAGLARRQTRLDCSRFTTPHCLRDWYHIPARPSDYPVHPNGSFGIFQPAMASWLPKDLDKFFGFFEPILQGQRPYMERINGGYYSSKPKDIVFNLESNLDFEYAMSLAWPQPVTNLQVGDRYLGGNLNHMLAAFDKYYCDTLEPGVDAQYPDLDFSDGYQSRDCGTYNAPKVISISYAWDEGHFPPEYLRRQCQEYLKLGLQGITVLAGSGDEGTAGRNETCAGSASRPFRVSFPASCPWVTAVGGT